MDSFAGNNQDPQSLHKYSYCTADPVTSVDPSGFDAYVVARPFDDWLLTWGAPLVVHVFLAFDESGLSAAEISQWRSLVSQLNNVNTANIMKGVPAYTNQPNGTTLSFHPYCVLNPSSEYEELGTFSTRATYVAYNAQNDRDAFDQAGEGWWARHLGRHARWRIVRSDYQAQSDLYRRAIASRDINNKAPESVDPREYDLPVFNCGGWVEYIVGPDRFPMAVRNLYATTAGRHPDAPGDAGPPASPGDGAGSLPWNYDPAPVAPGVTLWRW